MAQLIDPATRAALIERVRFYRDLGLTEFYRRPIDSADAAGQGLAGQVLAGQVLAGQGLVDQVFTPDIEPAIQSRDSAPEASDAPEILLPSESNQSSPQETPTIAPRKPIFTPPEPQAITPAADRAAALQLIRDDNGDCTRCALHQGRNKIVFSDGPPDARLMFVGEGPGADEDAQGIPFVGKAGQLLNNMIVAMGLRRDEVYIANVVKCRPPGNRTPEPVEGNTCSPFLFRQIDVVHPQVIVALGATAATYLLGQRQPLAGLRGRVHAWRGMSLIVTYHPAFLLRDPRQKKEAWADLQIAMRELGLKPSKNI